MIKNLNFKKYVAIGFIILCIISFIPMLMIAHYNFPGADDFSYGLRTGAIWRETGSVFAVLVGAFNQMIKTYFDWQGSYTAIFLMALQPGVFDIYWIGTYILLGTYILATVVLCHAVFTKFFKADKYNTSIITSFILIFSIQFMPGVVEAFYWFNGSIYYTFFYSLALIYIALHVYTITNGVKLWRNILMYIMAFLIGGGNYCLLLPLLGIELLFIMYALYKKNNNRISFVVSGSVLLIGFIINVVAPGNSIRQSSNSLVNPIKAILMSFGFEIMDFIKWFDLPVIIGMILIIPILWSILKKVDFKFSYPVVFTLMTVCVYAMQYTAPYYASSNIWLGRIYAQLYYAFYVLLISNLLYWLGWFKNKIYADIETKNSFDRILNFFTPYKAIVTTLLIVSFIMSFYVLSRKTSPSYVATMDLLNGNAQQYAEELQARQDLYEDDTIKDVAVEQLTVKPYNLFLHDFTNAEDDWRRTVIQDYYNKDSLKILD